MEESDIASVILRGTHLAALASLFGTLVFQALVLRALPATAWAERVRARLARLVGLSLLLALVLGVLWLIARAGSIAGASSLKEALEALPLVVLDTRFGQLLLARGALLLALAPLCLTDPSQIAPTGRQTARGAATAGGAASAKRRAMPAAYATARGWKLPTAIALAGGALVLQAASSHAGAMAGVAGWELVFVESLHVLAAGAWLGSLVPLLICLAVMPAEPLARVLRRFFPLGATTVLIIAGTSLVQAVALVGSLPALIGTTFGLVALVKLALFLGLLVCATFNRFVFGARPGPHLRRSIAVETALAAGVLLAAGTLAHLTPGVHEQAAWPFAWRLNQAASGPLFVKAYPTSFFASPTGFAADAIRRGEHLYQADCASCHGGAGQGQGPGASSLPIAPPDLTTDQIRSYSDGDLFWLAGHDGATSPADRWDLVDYLRAQATGAFVRASGRGRINLRIPRFNAVCADGRDIDQGDLRGKVLRILVPPAAHPMVTSAEADQDLITIRLPATAADRPDPSACVAQPETGPALALLLGATPEALAGNELLIDGNGWLRARWRPGQRGGWATPDLLLTRVQALAHSPLPADPTTGHVHHQ
jgi:putative copper export protein